MAKQRQRKDDEDENDKETSSSAEEREEEDEDGASDDEEPGEGDSDDEAEDSDSDDDESEDSDEDEPKDSDSEDEESDDEESEDEDRSSEPPREKVAAEGSDSDDEEDDGEEEEEELLPANLGAQRYVYSAFFAATIVGGYIFGRAVETAWARLAISDWAVDKVPSLTAVTDDSKQTYSFIVGGLVAVLIAIRQFRKESVRKWSDDVTAELLKVKWPTRKEVYASTVVVLATSAVAIVYLFLLDRFWSFVTNLIYGSPT